MKRLLCIVGSMNAGGAETFMMKMYRAIDKEKYQFDFCVVNPGEYDSEIKQLGGKIFFTTPKTKGPIRAFNSIRKIVLDNKYDYVMRISQNAISVLELVAAACGGAKHTIFRSSNTQTCGGIIENVVHKLFMPLARKVPDVCIAPSTEAADFMFGINSVSKGRTILVHNAIDIRVFEYCEEKRAEIRNSYGIRDEIVVGHIGRFNFQKNHKFLLKVFSAFHERVPKSVLMLVGDGELREEITELSDSMGIKDAVIFTGVQKDIPAHLCGMDMFVFPSLFEGMPNTIIEAQATGLPCIISDQVTKESNITGNEVFVSLENENLWVDKMVEYTKTDKERMSPIEQFMQNKYDIQSASNQFVKVVFKD